MSDVQAAPVRAQRIGPGRTLRAVVRSILSALGWGFCRAMPTLRPIYETRDTQTRIFFKHLIWQRLLGFNRGVYWPVHFTSIVSGSRNIYCGIETSPGYMPGCYIQGIGKIYIGDYTQIAANVGIISANPDPCDNRKHQISEVRIGQYCWIGMNAMILPGVVLGDFTVVGAGAVVTKSFEEGYCVVGGNPARLINRLEPAACVRGRSQHEYNGYIRQDRFEAYRKAHLDI
jgi:acetyltransferase-like isoleucine patch superfamily enzyme